MAEGGPAPRGGMISFELDPLDVLFFRDGRPFDATPRAATGRPMPQTVAGALRTWLLGRLEADFATLGAAVRNGASFGEATAAQGTAIGSVGRLRVRGPWFVKHGERLVPTPATIEAGKNAGGKMHRLDPLAEDLPGWSPPMDGLRPLWRRSRGPARARGGWLCRTGLEGFLAGGLPHADEVVDTDALFDTEDRVGIGVDTATQTAGEGMIYAVRLMRLVPGVTLAVDLVGTPEDLDVCPDDDDVLPLGGEARRAIIRRLCRAHRWPKAPAESGDGRLLLLTAPAPFGGWRPPRLSLVAAAVPDPVPVSGWDMARGGPKPNRFAAQAGSVYFCGKETDLPDDTDSLCTGEDAAVGWGTFLEGAWNHA